MLTKKLYYENAYIKEFSACVQSCTQVGDMYELILDQTAFFPEEGGQYADSGTIDGINVINVIEKDGIICHLTESAVKEGKTVFGILNFTERFLKMQAHSGEHVVSGIIFKLYGYDNVGFHLGHDDVTLDFNGTLTDEDVLKIEHLANETVYRNLNIVCSFPTGDELKTLNYRSKLELYENVRIVTIEDIDVCACCAPHVAQTGEIGIIKLTDRINYKGGTRLHMLCGSRALEDYEATVDRVRNICRKLSLKSIDIVRGFERLSDEIDGLKYQNSLLKKKILSSYIDTLEMCEKPIIRFEDILDIQTMREYVNAALNYTSKFCAVFCKNDDGTLSFIISSATSDARDIGIKLREAFGAKCGGNEKSISGKMTAKSESIYSLLNEF